MKAHPHKVRVPRRKAGTLLLRGGNVVTLRGASSRPRTAEGLRNLGVLKDGCVFVEDGDIRAVGPADEVASYGSADQVIDATGKVILPGFVDAHTHLVFGGSREDEVAMKAEGLSYPEIARRGGGILRTVRATRGATVDDLVAQALPRLRALLRNGTTTAEVKTGYGLTAKDEGKMLETIRRLSEEQPVELVPTFLGAHALPEEFAGDREGYIDLVLKEMLPAAATVAHFCDVFADAGYFTIDEARRILSSAQALGLGAKLHADELSSSGGAELAAEIGARSADHLLHASAKGIERMAAKGVVGVLLPATSLSSRLPYADGRALVAAGVPVALGTDFSPNSWCDSMPLVLSFACHGNRLFPEEAITAATANAAHAIGVADRVGTIEAGRQADLIVVNLPDAAHLPYRIGAGFVEHVVKSGQLVV